MDFTKSFILISLTILFGLYILAWLIMIFIKKYYKGKLISETLTNIKIKRIYKYLDPLMKSIIVIISLLIALQVALYIIH